ncbi:MAG: DUF1730 domain-containing protein [Clostridia bacterium]|nr:DUF1730 domain-containing protein [Clostridia bacterium]
MTDALRDILLSCGAASAGAVPLSALRPHMPAHKLARAERELPGAVTLLCTVFPYLRENVRGNVSLYSRSEDYHEVVGRRLAQAESALRRVYPQNRFKIYIDASPYPEVLAAAAAGLGVIGRNGLLITPRYGSFVFIGTIAADLAVEYDLRQPESCPGCGECVRRCPGGAIGAEGVAREKCVSHISQKKGELSDAERQVLKAAGTVWGCDICQLVCPLNRGCERSPLADFEPLLSELERMPAEEILRRYGSCAFLWKGAAPLVRNLDILEDAVP